MSALIVVNFKTYASAQGEAAVSLAKAMEKIDETTNSTMVAVVSAFDLSVVKAAAPNLEV